MSFKLELKIAFRYLFTRRKEGFISIINTFALIGIILGVATLIIVMSVMNGYEKELIKKILGIKGHITISNREFRLLNYEELTEKISQNIDNIIFLAPSVEGQAIILHGKFVSGMIIKGIDKKDLMHKPIMNKSINNILNYDDGVLIGKSLASELKIQIGDTVKLIAPSTVSTIIGLIPRIKSYKVVGIFDVGVYEYNMTNIFMPLKLAQKFFDYNNSVTHIELILNDTNIVREAQNKILSLLQNDYIVSNWEMENQSLAIALRIERNVMFLILSLIIVIAVFNVISSLVILVKDKTKSIAILRTLGLSKCAISRIFIICGASIGILGTIVGAIIGICFSKNIDKIKAFLENLTGSKIFDPVIYYLTELPSAISYTQVLMIISISILLSFLATIYPAIKVARMSPAIVLRYDI